MIWFTFINDYPRSMQRPMWTWEIAEEAGEKSRQQIMVALMWKIAVAM